MSFSRYLLVLVLIGFALRIVAAFWSFGFRENTDVLRYRDWARIAYLHNFADTYKPDYLSFGTLINNQPPGSLYIISGMYNINILVAKIILRTTGQQPEILQLISGPLLNFSLRLPSIIADLLIGFLIFIFVKTKTSEKLALIASSIFLFNPVVIYNSSFWGQMDSINNLFLLGAIYCLYKRKIEFVLPLFFLSLYVKFSHLPLLPVFIILLLIQSKNNIKKIILSIAYGLSLILLLTIPISKTPWDWILSYLSSNSLGEMKNITAFAFNFWWVILKPSISIGTPTSLFNFSEIRLIGSPQDNVVYFGLTLFQWAIAIFTLFILPIVYFIIRKREKIIKPDYLLLTFSISTLLIFLFLPRVHERYIYPVFPLLAAYVGLTKKFLITYVFLSICSLINLYIVWHPMIIPLLTYELINNSNLQWFVSVIILTTGVIFYIKVLRILSKK